jgi:hypothetical protein
MRSRSFLPNVVIVALLLLAIAVQGVWAQEQPPREETGPKTLPEAVAAPAGILTEDLSGPLTPEDLVYTLACGGLNVSNVKYTGVDVAAGVFQGGAGIIGFDNGIILSTGNIVDVVGPNTQDDIGVDNGAAGDTQLDALAGYPTHDAAVLEFDFLANANKVQFRYVFASDEYNEFVGSEYNDVFAFYVNGVNCATIGSDAVSVNTVNGTKNSGSYINNDIASGAALNTEMDGLTTVLICNAAVNPTAPNHVKLAIADASDFIYDSNVFIEACSLTCCVGDNCPDDPELSKNCTSTAPPFYVVVNRSFEDLSRPGTGCQPIILKQPECKDCCNPEDPACNAANTDMETRVCPLLAKRVDWSKSSGTETVYQMCCGETPECKGNMWSYRIRELRSDGTCPIQDETCYACLPPGTGIDLPGPVIVGGLAIIGLGMLAVGVVIRTRTRKTA